MNRIESFFLWIAKNAALPLLVVYLVNFEFGEFLAVPSSLQIPISIAYFLYAWGAIVAVGKLLRIGDKRGHVRQGGVWISPSSGI